MGRKRIYFAADGRLLASLVEPLEQAGLVVVPFDGQAALVSRATLDPPDALLIKARLIDGTALDAFNALPADVRVPTIVILSQTQGALRPTLLKAGIQDVAMSPIHPRELADQMVQAAGGFKRSDRRVAVALAVTVDHEGRTIRGVTVDISRAGLGLNLREGLPANAIVTVRLIGQTRTLEVYGRVLHTPGTSDRGKIGVRLIGLSDAEEALLMSLARREELSPVLPDSPVAPSPPRGVPGDSLLAPQLPGQAEPQPPTPRTRKVTGNGRFLDGSFDLPSNLQTPPPTDGPAQPPPVAPPPLASPAPLPPAAVAVLPTPPAPALQNQSPHSDGLPFSTGSVSPLEWHDIDLDDPATVPPPAPARFDSRPPDWPKGSGPSTPDAVPLVAPVHAVPIADTPSRPSAPTMEPPPAVPMSDGAAHPAVEEEPERPRPSVSAAPTEGSSPDAGQHVAPGLAGKVDPALTPPPSEPSPPTEIKSAEIPLRDVAHESASHPMEGQPLAAIPTEAPESQPPAIAPAVSAESAREARGSESDSSRAESTRGALAVRLASPGDSGAEENGAGAHTVKSPGEPRADSHFPEPAKSPAATSTFEIVAEQRPSAAVGSATNVVREADVPAQAAVPQGS